MIKHKYSTTHPHYNTNVKYAYIYVATFQQLLHMEYISLRWYDIPELVVPIRMFLIEGCC
jgi:hypothetical protein